MHRLRVCVFVCAPARVRACLRAYVICAPSRLSEVSPSLPLKQFLCSSDWPWPSLSSFQGRSSAASVHTSLFRAIDGVMYLALCPQLMSQVPQHLGFSRLKLAVFAHQSICSVISLHSGLSGAVHLQEISKAAVDHWHIPVWASPFGF